MTDSSRQRGGSAGILKGSRGFTLIEVVVTIVVTAILSISVFSYIGDAVNGLTATGNRNRLASSGRAVIDRIALELQNAVPNSVRVTAGEPGGGQCLEYMPFVQATTYLDAAFTGAGSAEFDAVDFSPPMTLASPAGVYAVIYPLAADPLYEAPASPGPLATVERIADPDAADGLVTVQLDEPHRFARRSPSDRLYIGDDPVSFCIEAGNVYRYADYGRSAVQCTPDTCLPGTAPGRARLGENIDNAGLQGFTVMEATLRRNAVVRLELNVSEAGDMVRLQRELVMRNTP